MSRVPCPVSHVPYTQHVCAPQYTVHTNATSPHTRTYNCNCNCNFNCNFKIPSQLLKNNKMANITSIFHTLCHNLINTFQQNVHVICNHTRYLTRRFTQVSPEPVIYLFIYLFIYLLFIYLLFIYYLFIYYLFIIYLLIFIII